MRTIRKSRTKRDQMHTNAILMFLSAAIFVRRRLGGRNEPPYSKSGGSGLCELF